MYFLVHNVHRNLCEGWWRAGVRAGGGLPGCQWGLGVLVARSRDHYVTPQFPRAPRTPSICGPNHTPRGSRLAGREGLLSGTVSSPSLADMAYTCQTNITH